MTNPLSTRRTAPGWQRALSVWRIAGAGQGVPSVPADDVGCTPAMVVVPRMQPKGGDHAWPNQGCAFRCCNPTHMAHILLYPGEIDEAASQGRSMAHLEILDSHFHGGARVRC